MSFLEFRRYHQHSSEWRPNVVAGASRPGVIDPIDDGNKFLVEIIANAQ
jgi:hypothetical protein